MTRVPISVLIPSFNSADVIEACLQSVAWADEIFVCDSFSTDTTLDICRRYGARIVQHEYVNSATQKNWAIPQVRHEWVLIVDTDERVSTALRAEIEAILTPDCPVNGFKIPRLNHVFNHPIHYGGHYPDYQLRLFRRDCGHYQPRQVHAHVDLIGPVGTLTNPLLHFGQRDIEQVTRTYLLRYTAWEAAQKRSEGVRFRSTDLIVRPVGVFLLRYVRQQGFRDGVAGLFMAVLVSCYVFLTYARLWQLQSSPGSHTPPGSPDHPTVGDPIRVAFLVPHTKVGGAEMNLRTLLSSLDGQHIDPLVLMPGQGDVTRLLADTHVAMCFVPTPHFYSTSLRLGARLGRRSIFNPVAVLIDCLLLGKAALAYSRVIRQKRIQVIHTGSIFAHLLGVLVARLSGTQLVWHVQDIVSPRLVGGLVASFFAQLGARCADCIVCPSESVAQSLRAFWPADISLTRLRVVHNGIVAPNLSPADSAMARQRIRREFGIPEDALTIVHIGRLVPWKGQREFLYAAQLVAKTQPDARFVVVGDAAFDSPGYTSDLHSLAQTLGIAHQVIFAGWRSDVTAILAASDIFVHSSTLPEPFGLVILEAMSMSLPVVVAASGGPLDIVRDGQEGFVVDPRDTGALASVLQRLATDPDLRRRLGASGRSRVLDHFTAGHFASGVAAVLRAADSREVLPG